MEGIYKRRASVLGWILVVLLIGVLGYGMWYVMRMNGEGGVWTPSVGIDEVSTDTGTDYSLATYVDVVGDDAATGLVEIQARYDTDYAFGGDMYQRRHLVVDSVEMGEGVVRFGGVDGQGNQRTYEVNDATSVWELVVTKTGEATQVGVKPQAWDYVLGLETGAVVRVDYAESNEADEVVELLEVGW